MDIGGAPASGDHGANPSRGFDAAARQRHEAQRFKHLVLGQPRPKSQTSRRRKGVKANRVVLEPGIEEQVALREDNPGAGTPQTLAKFSDGSMQRLLLNGDITPEQKACAESIADTAERIVRGIGVRTCSYEVRVDRAQDGDAALREQLGAVRRERAYSEWRAQLIKVILPLHELIVEDMKLTDVARRYRMDNRRLKKLLIEALDLWPKIIGRVCKEIDLATLVAAQAGILS